MAKTTTWTGATDTTWATSGNWTNGVPSSGDSVFFSGSTPPTTGVILTLAVWDSSQMSGSFTDDGTVTSGITVTTTLVVGIIGGAYEHDWHGNAATATCDIYSTSVVGGDAVLGNGATFHDNSQTAAFYDHLNQNAVFRDAATWFGVDANQIDFHDSSVNDGVSAVANHYDSSVFEGGDVAITGTLSVFDSSRANGLNGGNCTQCFIGSTDATVTIAGVSATVAAPNFPTATKVAKGTAYGFNFALSGTAPKVAPSSGVSSNF